MSLVVTGATGNLGRLVIEGLLTAQVPPEQVVAVVRSRDKGAAFAERGIEVRIADYAQPETLAGAFATGDRVLMVSAPLDGQPRMAHHQAVVEAAKEAGVALLAYTGVLGGPEADYLLADDHKATEQAILASKVPYTFLRNSWYNENLTRGLPAIIERGTVVGSAGEGRVASASHADHAAAAVAVLTGGGHENQAYELNGDLAWTHAEYAAELSRQTGRTVTYRNVTAEEHLALYVGAGVPAAKAEILVDVDAAMARGLFDRRGSDLSRLIGRPTTPLSATIETALAD